MQHSRIADRVRAAGPIALILLLALAVRLAGVDFGLPAVLDPDELIFEMGAYHMIEGGALNPGWFGHPATTTMYVLALILAATFLFSLATGRFETTQDFVAAIFPDPGIVILPGRIAMVLFAVWSVYLLYRLACELFDRSTGMLAAVILALSPVHASWSQVIRSDVMATCFMLAAMLAALRYLRRPGRRQFVLCCCLAGLAIATKWPFGVALLAMAGAIVGLQLRREITPPTAIRRLALAGLLTLAALLLASPYLLLDFHTAIGNLRGEAQTHHLGSNGYGFVGNMGFYLREPLLAGLGPLVLAVGLCGLLPRRSLGEFGLVVGLPAATLLLIMCLQDLVWERWALPLIPVLAISASHFAMQLWHRAAGLSWPRAVVPGLAIVMALLATAPLVVTMVTRHAERVNDNRRLATDWAREHLPAGSSIMVEHFAMDLHDTSFSVLFPLAIGGCLDARNLLGNEVDLSFVNSQRGGNANMDYAAVPADRRASCAADYAIITEYGRYQAEADRYPEQVAAYRDLLATGRVIQTFHSVPGEVGGRPVVQVVAFGPDGGEPDQ